MKFDIEGARKAGYSDTEIADYVGTENKYDVAGARKAGYKDDEIISFLSEPEDTGILGEVPKGLKAGVQQLRGMGYGIGALAGKAVGSEGVTEWAKEGLKDVEEKTPAPAVASFRDVSDLESAAKYLTYGVASNLPNLALSLAGGIGGLGIGARLAGKQAAKEVVKSFAKRGALAGAGLTSFGMEAGSIAADQLTETGEVSPLRAVAGAVPAAALDVIPEWYLMKKIGLLADSGLLKEGIKERLKYAGKTALQQTALEAPTEAMQSVIERASVPGKSITNKEAWDEYINSFILGGATGGVAGGVGGVFAKRNTAVQDELQKDPHANDIENQLVEADPEGITKPPETAWSSDRVPVRQPSQGPPPAGPVPPAEEFNEPTRILTPEETALQNMQRGNVQAEEGAARQTSIQTLLDKQAEVAARQKGFASEAEALMSIRARRLSPENFNIEQTGERWVVTPKENAQRIAQESLGEAAVTEEASGQAPENLIAPAASQEVTDLEDEVAQARSEYMDASTDEEIQVAQDRLEDVRARLEEAKSAQAKAETLNNLNPSNSVFANYESAKRATMPLGKNITTLDKTMGETPDEIITVYRGVPEETDNIVGGDYVTTNKQLAKDYAGTGKVIEKEVRLSELLDDKTEPLGEEYIYRVAKPANATATISAEEASPDAPTRDISTEGIPEPASIPAETKTGEPPVTKKAISKKNQMMMFSRAERKPLYSKLQKTIEDSSIGKMSVPQLKAFLKNKQVADDEIEVLTGGLEGTVTKQQVVDELKTKIAGIEEAPLATGATKDDVQAVADMLTSGLRNAFPIGVYSNIKDTEMQVNTLGAMHRNGVIDENGDSDVAGMVFEDKIYLFAENISGDIDSIRTVVKHELFHNGFQTLFKKLSNKNQKFMPYLTQVESLLDELWKAKESAIRRNAAENQSQLKIDDKESAFVRTRARRKAAEEWLAHQAPESETKWYDRIAATVKRFLRDIGFKTELSDSEVRTIIADSYAALRGDVPTGIKNAAPLFVFGAKNVERKLLSAIKNPKPLEPWGQILRIAERYNISRDVSRETKDSIKETLAKAPSVEELAATGWAGKALSWWYQDDSEFFKKVMGKDAWKFLGVLAATSPQSKAETENIRLAVNVWEKYAEARKRLGREPNEAEIKELVEKANIGIAARKSGVERVLMGKQLGKTEEVMKTRHYHLNLLGMELGSVIDIWHGRGSGLLKFQRKGDTIELKQDVSDAIVYAVMSERMDAAAKILGLPQSRSQAAQWGIIKAIWDKLEDTRGRLYPPKDFLDKITNKDVALAGNYTTGIANYYAKNDPIIDRLEAIGIPRADMAKLNPAWRRLSERGIDPDGKVYANAPAEIKAQIDKLANRLETAKKKMVAVHEQDRMRERGEPGMYATLETTHGALAELPLKKRRALHNEIRKNVLTNDEIRNVATRFGLLLVDVVDGPGKWFNPKTNKIEYNPNFTPILAVPPGKTKVELEGAIRAFAATLAHANRQEAFGYTHPVEVGELFSKNGGPILSINLGKTISFAQAEKLEAEIEKAFPKGDVYTVPTQTGVIISMSKDGEFYSHTYKDFAKKTQTALDNSIKDDVVDIQTFEKDSFESGDYYEKAGRQLDTSGAGKGIERGVPSFQDAIRDEGGLKGLRAADKLLAGIDAVKEKYATRKIAAALAAERVRTEPAQAERREPSGAFVRAEGVHFSGEQRKTLSSSYYGTGLKGAEASRLDGQPDLQERIYFYTNIGNGIKKEPGLGQYAHRVKAEPYLYDLAADPLGLMKNNKDANAIERAVIDNGYDGYFNRRTGVAVLLGEREIDTEPVDPTTVPEAPPLELTQAQILKNELRSNRDIPQGQQSGTEWVKSLAKHPELYDRLNELGYIEALHGVSEKISREEIPDVVETAPSFSRKSGAEYAQGINNYLNAARAAWSSDEGFKHPGVIKRSFEYVFGSPEHSSHPVMKALFKIFRDRNGWFNEYFLRFAEGDHPDRKHDTMTEALDSLDDKQYDSFAYADDEMDTAGYTQDEARKYMADNKTDPDVIEAWEAKTARFNTVMDTIIENVQEQVNEIEESAAFRGVKPHYPRVGYETDAYGEVDLNSPIDLKNYLGVLGEMKKYAYSPRIREYGAFQIRAEKKAEGRKFMQFAKNKTAAEKIRLDLMAEGWKDITVGHSKVMSESVLSGLKEIDILKVIGSAIDDMNTDSVSDAYSAELVGAIHDIILARGFRRHQIGRESEIVEGYETDPRKKIFTYLVNSAAGMAKAKAAKQAMQVMIGGTKTDTLEGYQTAKTLGEYHKTPINPNEEGRAYDAAKKYISDNLRNIEDADRAVAFVKKLATFKYLSWTLRAPLVNTTALITTVAPSIHQYAAGGKGSLTNIFKEIGKAGVDYYRVMRGDAGALPAGEQNFIDEINRRNYDDPQMVRDMMTSMQGSSGRTFDVIVQLGMKPFSYIEQWMRGLTILAAYRVARPNMSEADAREIAIETAGMAHGTYGKATRQYWAQGTDPAARIGQVATTFLKFPQNYLNLLYDLGMDKKNIKAFTWALAAPIVLGGAAAIPFKDNIIWMINAIMKGLGDDRDIEKMVYDGAREYLGKEAEKNLRTGIAGWAGIDITGSLSMNLGLPTDVLGLTGIFGAMAKETYRAGHFVSTKQYSKALETALPSLPSNALRAIRELDGATAMSGNRVWNEDGTPYVPGKSETALRIAGFRSSKRTTTQQRDWEIDREIKRWDESKGKIYERYRAYIAKPKRNDDEFKSIMQDVAAFNKAIVARGRIGMVVPIRPQQLKKIIRDMARQSKSERRKRAS